MKSIRHKAVAIVAIAALAILASQASANIISTGEGNEAAYSLTQDELGETATVSSVALFGGWSQDLTKLKDNSMGPNPAAGSDVNGTDGAPTSITYTFPTNSFGYDITGIETYAGWDTGGGRANQGYAIELTLVDNSTSTLLPKTTWYANATNSFWTRVVHTNNGGGVLDNGLGIVATGVKSVTLTNFDNAKAGGPAAVAYREIEIYGTASVPEPGTALLLVTGLMGLLCYAWKKRK